MYVRYKIALAALIGSIGLGSTAYAQNEGGNFNPGPNQYQNQPGFRGPGAGWQNYHRGWLMHRWAEMNRAAHFRIKQGDSEIDVRCPANQNLQNCTQATQQFIQMIQQMGNENTERGGNTSAPQGQ